MDYRSEHISIVPTYPLEAQQLGWQSRAFWRLSMDEVEAGKQCQTQGFSGHSILDQAALDGHSLWNPRASAMNADGWGIVIIALNANGARCA